MTLAELNAFHVVFYRENHRQMERRLAKPKVARHALKIINADNSKPIREQMSLEYALELSELVVRKKAMAAGRKGGATPKADSLTCLIRSIVERRHRISTRRLVYKLKAEEGKGVIISVNVASHIKYKKDDDTIVTIPISALKDRLYRVRMEILSR